jgi:ADP-ribose pyrophosphatase
LAVRSLNGPENAGGKGVQSLFFYGTLCHLPLLKVVLGRQADSVDAVLADHAVSWVQGQAFPMIRPHQGAFAQGLLVRGLDDGDLARIAFYTAGYSVDARNMSVTTDNCIATAVVYFPDTSIWQPGRAWLLADWASTWGETAAATAGDVMALFGLAEPAAIAARRGAMLVRGASRVRAGRGLPATLRREPGTGDVQVEARHYAYANFFSVEEYNLSFRRFDGTMSPVVNRATFISGDAVTVLPYDPVRDRVLLVEQFRAGPYARGDANPWQLEAIAGRIDPGETAEDAARREAVEEAGLDLGALLPVAGYYPTPGAKTEFLYSYVALVDLPDGAAGVFGVEGEAEDIRGHLVPFERLMALVASGEISNAPLILTALWLQRERGRLRGL